MAGAQPAKRVFLASDAQTDYMWTADEETYRQAYLEMVDYYLDQADRTAGEAADHQARWNCDGSLWMWTYEKNRTAAQFKRFVGRCGREADPDEVELAAARGGEGKRDFHANECVGGYAEPYDPGASLDFIETNARFRQVWPYEVTGIFGKDWDRLKTMNDEVVTAAKKRTTAERRLIVSNEEDLLRDFEATYGKDLPRFSAAFGNEWDLYIASVAELSARARRVTERLRTAEALAALVSLRRPEFMKGRESARG